MGKQEILSAAIKEGARIGTTIHAIGDGQWSLEVYGDDEYLFELIGSNGTRYDEGPDDLHGQLSEMMGDCESPKRPEQRQVKRTPRPKPGNTRR